MSKKIRTVDALRLVAELEQEHLPYQAKLYTTIADELEALRAENKRLKAQERAHIVNLRPSDIAPYLRDYGQLGELFTALKATGWTRASVDYVRARVWYE
jgi:hypothetical protein